MIEPATAIMEGDAGGQPGADPSQGMGAFPSQAQGMDQFVMDTLDDLAPAREGAAQGAGPGMDRAAAERAAFRWNEHTRLILDAPARRPAPPSKPVSAR